MDMNIPEIRSFLEHCAANPPPRPEFRFDRYRDNPRHDGEVLQVTHERYLPALAALIAKLRPINMLTIGALYGTLETCLLQCHGGRDWLGTITICDLDIPDYNANRDNGSLIYRNICGTQYGAFQRTFTHIRGSSQWPDVIAKIHAMGCYDLIFIDGEHTREAVMRDLDTASECVTRDGTILVHDTELFSSSVPQGWHEWAHANPRWRCDAVPNSTFLHGLGFAKRSNQ